MPSMDFPQTRSGIAEALTFVESETRQLGGVDPSLVDRVVLVAGEVLANAVEHGTVEPGRRVRVAVGGTASAVTLTIHGASDGIELHRFDDARLPRDVLATDGRGLFLVRSLADAIEAEGAGGLTFRFSPRRAP